MIGKPSNRKVKGVRSSSRDVYSKIPQGRIPSTKRHPLYWRTAESSKETTNGSRSKFIQLEKNLKSADSRVFDLQYKSDLDQLGFRLSTFGQLGAGLGFLAGLALGLLNPITTLPFELPKFLSLLSPSWALGAGVFLMTLISFSLMALIWTGIQRVRFYKTQMNHPLGFLSKSSREFFRGVLNQLKEANTAISSWIARYSQFKEFKNQLNPPGWISQSSDSRNTTIQFIPLSEYQRMDKELQHYLLKTRAGHQELEKECERVFNERKRDLDDLKKLQIRLSRLIQILMASKKGQLKQNRVKKIYIPHVFEMDIDKITAHLNAIQDEDILFSKMTDLYRFLLRLLMVFNKAQGVRNAFSKVKEKYQANPTEFKEQITLLETLRPILENLLGDSQNKAKVQGREDILKETSHIRPLMPYLREIKTSLWQSIKDQILLQDPQKSPTLIDQVLSDIQQEIQT